MRSKFEEFYESSKSSPNSDGAAPVVQPASHPLKWQYRVRVLWDIENIGIVRGDDGFGTAEALQV